MALGGEASYLRKEYGNRGRGPDKDRSLAFIVIIIAVIVVVAVICSILFAEDEDSANNHEATEATEMENEEYGVYGDEPTDEEWEDMMLEDAYDAYGDYVNLQEAGDYNNGAPY